MFEWILIVGGLMTFFASMGIGANDVANAFATSIGSGALTMKAAIGIAMVFELAGALLMGSHVTETIRKGIADYQCFEDNPYVLMYGCMYVLFSVGVWLFLASKYEMPVSTTHSCVGGMIGMTIALGGFDCVNWYTLKDTFPYVGGVSGIVLSWIFSPVLSLLFSCILFSITRCAILRQKNSFNISFYSFPVFVGLTLMLNIFFIIYKGGKGIGLDDIEPYIAIPVSISSGVVVGLIMIPFMPLLKKCIIKKFNKKNEKELECIENPNMNNELKSDNIIINETKTNETKQDIDNNEKKMYNKSTDISSKDNLLELNSEKKDKKLDILKSLNYKIKYDVDNDKLVNKIHENAEKFDEKTEESFKFLQIFTAICDSFSHGANDIANAVGPFQAIWTIYNTSSFSKKNEIDANIYWILALGGIGMSLGLALYGYKIIRTIGVKMCKITPSRGFAIELGSALTIIIGSRFGIPLSTTHCQIGATMGIGLLENGNKNKDKKNCLTSFKEFFTCKDCRDSKTNKCCSKDNAKKCTRKCFGLNSIIIIKTIAGWVLTLVVVGVFTGLLVAQGIYSPCPGYVYNKQINNTNSTNFTS